MKTLDTCTVDKWTYRVEVHVETHLEHTHLKTHWEICGKKWRKKNCV